jgi:hypothetical protein
LLWCGQNFGHVDSRSVLRAKLSAQPVICP